MAKIPTPRSFNRILGDMLDAFLSRFGLKQLRVGSPVLSILEAAAQSDLRASQDTFNLLAATNLDRAEGIALDRIGLDEDTPRLTESAASGTVTIQDSRIQKVTTKVYQGQAAPIAGSAQINVVNAGDGWPASGKVYIGRGTSNLEGPLEYASKTDNGSYWTLNLAPGNYTKKFHNTGEAVTLAQNGNRTIGAGTIVQTPQGNASDAVQFGVLYSVTIPDGEVEVDGVIVVARKLGTIGNVPEGAINGFASAPFPGATVTNALPFSNGHATETDSEYRERIRNTRRSRSLGTALAIKTKVSGITSVDENKRVTSATTVRRKGYPTTLYIDDGTGYEERASGIAIEPLNDSSLGGEQYFQLSERPIAKAFLETSLSAPFVLESGMKLAVRVGGVLYEHTFTASEFLSVSNATAFEVVASINANPLIGFSARTGGGGTRVVIFAKEDENEDIEVVSPENGENANSVLLFPAGRTYTLRLYKNDRLLSKDGSPAIVRGLPHGEWDAIVPGDTLEVAIDGTQPITFTFTNNDFINADTGFVSVANHTLEAWVKVLNAKIPGITASASANAIALTSNVGRTSRARVDIVGGSVVTKGMFDITTSQGSDRDYTLDRNTGQVRLEIPLVAGDRLAAGSVNSRAFVESRDITPVTLTSNGIAYVCADGGAQLIKTGITAANNFNLSTVGAADVWGQRYRLEEADGNTVFVNAQPGDWLIVWDSNSAWAGIQGLWQVVDSGPTYIDIEGDAALVTQTNKRFVDLGLAVVRYAGQPQKVTVPAAPNYTPSTFVAAINDDLDGAEAVTYRSSRIRLRTNSYGANGDIAIVGLNAEAGKLLLPVSSAIANRDSHLGSVETQNTEHGTPNFGFDDVNANVSNSLTAFSTTSTVAPDRVLVGLKNIPATTLERYGNHRFYRSSIKQVVGGIVTVREPTPQALEQNDRFYLAAPYAIGPEDDFTVVVDGDINTKRFAVPLWRALRPAATTYGATNAFKDIGNGSQAPTSLTGSFGLNFDFNDFAVYMRARAKTHDGSSSAILWRHKRFGPEGEQARVRYVYPSGPAQALKVVVDPLPTDAPSKTNISIVLPSDVKKAGYALRNTTSVGYGYNKGVSPIGRVTLALGFSINSAARVSGTTTLTLTLPTGMYAITSHGIPVGANIWVQSSSPSFISGVKTVTAVTSNTISYADVGVDATAGSIGTVSLDPSGEASWSNATPAAIAVGDLIRLEDSTNIPADFRGQTIRITYFSAQLIQGYAERDGGVETQTVSWEAVNDSTRISVYGLKAAKCTATEIQSAISALDAKCPVTATLLGNGGGSVLLSTREELLTTDWYDLKDGLNWVKTTTKPVLLSNDYELEFKSPIEASLVSDSDWANEEVRIVPITTKALVEWMRIPSVSGLFTSCSVLASSQAAKVQLASLTAGSEGSVQVQGGTANTAVAAIVGTGVSSGNYSIASTRVEDIVGFHAGHWVVLENTKSLPKAGLFTAATELQSITADGKFTLVNTSPPLFTLISTDPLVKVQVEKQGRFVCVVGYGNAALAEGDWVYIKGAGTNSIDTSNQGIFRVVRATATCFWFENPNARAQAMVEADIAFFTGDSMMPGDVVAISTDAWGVDNRGQWVVEFIGDQFSNIPFSDAYQFRVRLADGQAMTPVTSPVAALGANEAKKVIVLEGAPSRLIKRIHAIAPHQFDTNLVTVKFDSSKRSSYIGAAGGTTMTALDKLNFPLVLSKGLDGYSHSTGLVGEAARVVYGDERDPATYPGVIAAGDNVNIAGPLVKRVQVSVAIRARLGVSQTDIADKVRSAVASAINKSGIGQAISISDIVNAASKVNGVQAVTVLFPTYGAGNDLIPVQPFEKALVLNIDQDVNVSFVGE